MEEGYAIGSGKVVELVGGFERLGEPVDAEGFDAGAGDPAEGGSGDNHGAGIDGDFGSSGNGCGSGCGGGRGFG